MDADVKQEIGRVLGRIPSGVWILTVRDQTGRETGMLASWVQQAAFEPPMVSIAVKQGRYIHDWLQQTGRAALSLVGESQKSLLSQFGKGFEPGEPAFTGCDTRETANGLTVLADSLGFLAGTIRTVVPAGDHAIYLLEVQEAQAGPRLDNEKPWVHLRKNGFNY